MKLKNVKINLFVFIGLLVLGFSFFSFAQENSRSENNIFLDSDQDGLSNEEEETYGTNPNNADTDGDGYSDGVEVRGGYDPLKSAPGDKLVQAASPDVPAEPAIVKKTGSATTVAADSAVPAEENLTQNLSTQVIDLINTKSAENKDISIEDLDGIISNISNQEISFENLPPINDDEIKIKKQDYSKLSDAEKTAREKEDSIAYLTAVAYILVNNSPQKISGMNDLEKIARQYTMQSTVILADPSKISQLDDITKKGSEALIQIKEVEVPNNLLATHKKGLQLANYAFNTKNEFEQGDATGDPVAQIINIGKAQGILGLLMNYTTEVSSQLETIGITTIPIDL